MKKAILVFGSARSHGNTRSAAEKVQSLMPLDIPLIDLLKCTVKPFSYDYDQNDDFSELITREFGIKLGEDQEIS